MICLLNTRNILLSCVHVYVSSFHVCMYMCASSTSLLTVHMQYRALSQLFHCKLLNLYKLDFFSARNSLVSIFKLLIPSYCLEHLFGLLYGWNVLITWWYNCFCRICAMKEHICHGYHQDMNWLQKMIVSWCLHLI